MADLGWEKPHSAAPAHPRHSDRTKFLIGGVAILAAVLFLVVSGMTAGARYFITVDELLANPAYIGQSLRISGAVIGETIRYDAETLTIDFTIANIPPEFEDLALALHQAVNDEGAARLRVRVVGEAKPDLLQHEAQAIITGRLDADGIFQVSELLLKCPTRFEEAHPGQRIVEPGA